MTAVTPATPAPKSCTGCSGLLQISDQNTLLGDNVGGQLCMLRQIPIGRPGQKDVMGKIEDLMGKDCSQHTTTTPRWDRKVLKETPFEIGVAFAKEPDDEPKAQDTIMSCRDCVFYANESTVADGFGWRAPMCRAKGTLLLRDRLTTYAAHCDKKSIWHPGAEVVAATETVLLAHYHDGYGKPTLTTLLKGRSDDPQNHKTDKPVTAEDAEEGIRAWRLLRDPDLYGADIYLPIFDRDFFKGKPEIDDIPMAGDKEHPEHYVDYDGFVYTVAVLWQELDETPAVWGEPGVGKTELFRHLAFLMALPFPRFSITPSTELADLIGSPQYSPENGTYFREGRLPRFWQQPCVICLDEPNSGPADVWMRIRPLTDNSKVLTLDEDDARHIHRHLHCYFGMAMNPAWDPRNTGVQTLADADVSRLVHLYKELPPPDVERRILAKSLAAEDVIGQQAEKILNLVMSIAPDIRGLSTQQAVPVTWGLRSQIKVARAMKFFTPLRAYRLAAVDSLEPSAQSLILDVVRAKTKA